MRILYIEDNPNDAQLAERYLSTTNFEYEIVSTVAEAQAQLHQPFHLILVDVLLDGNENSLDFVRSLRAAQETVPIVAITGLTTQTEQQRCLDAGCNTILTKPYEVLDLAKTIEQFVT